MFRELILELMEEKQMTKMELVTLSGVGPASLYEFLHGTRDIQTRNLERLLTALKWHPPKKRRKS